jgi:hypothetical protein
MREYDLNHPIFKIYSRGGPEKPEIPAIKIKSFMETTGGIVIGCVDRQTARNNPIEKQ